MPVRLPYRSVKVGGGLLSSYWGLSGYHRPNIDLYLVGPTGNGIPVKATIDTASDFVVFEHRYAGQLGLSPPFARTETVSGIAGAAHAQFSAPPDGTVSICVTDLTKYLYLPAPLVGFWDSPASTRNVLGFTGFLQFFDVSCFNGLTRPEVELTNNGRYAVQEGDFDFRLPLIDFFRRLKLGP